MWHWWSKLTAGSWTPPGEEADVVEEAREWLLQAPARRLTGGFLGDHPGEEVLTPHRSGSSGLWVGTIKAVRGKNAVTVAPRHTINCGDRLRVESTDGKQKAAFRVTEILSEKDEYLPAAGPGSQVALTTAGHYAVGERLFKVAGKGKNPWKSPSTLWRMIQQETPNPLPFARNFIQRRQVEAGMARHFPQIGPPGRRVDDQDRPGARPGQSFPVPGRLRVFDRRESQSGTDCPAETHARPEETLRLVVAAPYPGEGPGLHPSRRFLVQGSRLSYLGG